MHTDSIICIPESVGYYFSKEYHRQRMQQFYKINTALPGTFTFDDTVKFYQAKANIEICKIELFQFMTEVFQKIWGKAFKEHGFTSLTQDMLAAKNIHENIYGGYTPDAVWDSQYNSIYWYYETNDTKHTMYLGCYTYEDNGHTKLSISFYIHDGSHWLYFDSIKEKLHPYWKKEEDDSTSFCLLDDYTLSIRCTQLDVEPLAKIARETLYALTECNQKKQNIT